MIKKKTIGVILPMMMLISLLPLKALSWGFLVHRTVNKHAVYCLPPEMVGFYKKHIDYITEHAIDPDKRAHVNKDEAIRHYIDIDAYGENCFDEMPQKWYAAVDKYSEDTLKKYGILPWRINQLVRWLTNAFIEKDAAKILFISTNLGHYMADATVPLHTSVYYNGKTPEQKGIHSFWESRIPELFMDKYNFFVGKAEYIDEPLNYVWGLVRESNLSVDTVYDIYNLLEKKYPEEKKFSFENKGANVKKVYNKDYSRDFDEMQNGLVERKIRVAIMAVSSIWYTAWVNAGQPDMNSIDIYSQKKMKRKLKKEEKKEAIEVIE